MRRGGDDDATRELASVLALALDDLVALLGGPWRRAPQPSQNQLGDPDDRWWMAGDPVQLMVTQEPSGTVLLAVPRGSWQGWFAPVYEPAKRLLVDLDGDPEAVRRAVAEALRLRRSSFRYCRYCRGLTPPEYRDEPDVCMGCSERWLRVEH